MQMETSFEMNPTGLIGSFCLCQFVPIRTHVAVLIETSTRPRLITGAAIALHAGMVEFSTPKALRELGRIERDGQRR